MLSQQVSDLITLDESIYRACDSKQFDQKHGPVRTSDRMVRCSDVIFERAKPDVQTRLFSRCLSDCSWDFAQCFVARTFSGTLVRILAVVVLKMLVTLRIQREELFGPS